MVTRLIIALTWLAQVACGPLTDGRAFSLQVDDDGRLVWNGAPLQISQVVLGPTHLCVRYDNDRVGCYGLDGDHPVARPGRYSDVALSDRHACGLLYANDGWTTSDAGYPDCWSFNTGPEFDDGWLREVPGVEPYQHVTGGPEGFCFVGSSVMCRLQGSWSAPLAWRGGASPHAALSYDHACVAGATGLACWGDTDFESPPPAALGAVADMVGGNSHTCALSTEGEITCWGSDSLGEVHVPEGTYIAVSAAGGHTCAITTDREVRCWGDPSEVDSAAAPSGLVSITTGNGINCGINGSGEAFCWGSHALPRVP